jgi:hypothetical protein
MFPGTPAIIRNKYPEEQWSSGSIIHVSGEKRYGK